MSDSIDYAVLGNWVATDESDEARQIRQLIESSIERWTNAVNKISFDWSLYLDHRRRYMMRRKIRRAYL